MFLPAFRCDGSPTTSNFVCSLFLRCVSLYFLLKSEPSTLYSHYFKYLPSHIPTCSFYNQIFIFCSCISLGIPHQSTSVSISDHRLAFCGMFSLLIVKTSWPLSFVIAAACSFPVKLSSVQVSDLSSLASNDVNVTLCAICGTFSLLTISKTRHLTFFCTDASYTCPGSSSFKQLDHFLGLAPIQNDIHLYALHGLFS